MMADGSMTTVDPDRIVDKAERRRIVPYSNSHIDRMEAAGDFPARVQLGGNRVGWWLSEVLAWAKARPRGKVGSRKPS